MGNVRLVLVMGLMLAVGVRAGNAWAVPPPDVGAGRIAWFDITTRDLAGAKDFYGKLLGWSFAPLSGTDQAVEIRSGAAAIGTLRGAEGQISAFNGVVYVQVTDVEVSLRKARELGGTIVAGFPFNLPDNGGAVGLFLDPSGHPLGLYSRTPLRATSQDR
jgi:predicted enzyme related to lactoylglutathione lyase